ncbi:MAG: ATP synthase F1 subunit epsilon [Chthonomonadaceae bacterium]|nr:ATP synthase F1 subunit epsilon [Chthonomonadaceae bacterium]
MAKLYRLSVVAPDRTVFDDEVSALVAPGIAGYLGVMADHEPAIVALKSGVVELLDKTGQREHVAITGGFLEVSAGGAIILADDARMATDIDIAEEQSTLEEARKALRGEPSRFNQQQAQYELDRAMARLKAAKGN